MTCKYGPQCFSLSAPWWREPLGHGAMTVSASLSPFLCRYTRESYHSQSLEIQGGHTNYKLKSNYPPSLSAWIFLVVSKHLCHVDVQAALLGQWAGPQSRQASLSTQTVPLLPGWQQQFCLFMNIKTQNNGMFSLSNALRKSIRPTCNFLRF